MAAPVFTELFARTYQVSAGAAYLYTVDDRATVVRDLVVNNYATVPNRLQVYVQSPGVTVHLFNQEVEASSSVHLDLRQRLLTDDTLYANGGQGGWSVAVTGYRFST